MVITKMVMSLLISISVSLTPNDKISGYIIDQYNKETLSGVKVSVNDSVFTYTDFDGYFQIKNDSDTTNLIIEYISYETKYIVFIKK